MKFIKTDDNYFFFFHDVIHADFAEMFLQDKKIIEAGFIDFEEESNNIKTYGKSISLNLSATKKEIEKQGMSLYVSKEKDTSEHLKDKVLFLSLKKEDFSETHQIHSVDYSFESTDFDDWTIDDNIIMFLKSSDGSNEIQDVIDTLNSNVYFRVYD